MFEINNGIFDFVYNSAGIVTAYRIIMATYNRISNQPMILVQPCTVFPFPQLFDLGPPSISGQEKKSQGLWNLSAGSIKELLLCLTAQALQREMKSPMVGIPKQMRTKLSKCEPVVLLLDFLSMKEKKCHQAARAVWILKR